MDSQRLARQPRTARQLPVALLRADHRPQFAHAPLVEGQRSADFEIARLEQRRLRPLPPRGRKSHLDDRRRCEHRHPLYLMVGYPRQNLLVDVVEPKRYWAALTKTEKRVIERRIDWIPGLGRSSKPESPPIPWVEWQFARVGRSVEY